MGSDIFMIPWICLLIMVFLFWWGDRKENPSKKRKPRPDIVPREERLVDTEYIRLMDSSGKKEVSQGNYKNLIVYGDSLEPIGICHDSLVLVKELSYEEYDNIKLPRPCVFHRYPEKEDKNQSLFTAGEVFWRICGYGIADIIPKILDDIFWNKTYRYFRVDPRYVSDSYVRENLKVPEGIKDISLMLKIDEEGKFRMVCIDSRDILGEIKYSYDLERTKSLPEK